MNRERVKELLPIIQAFAEGKQIEWKYPRDSMWVRGIHSLNDLIADGIELRIKPESFECWVTIWPSEEMTASHNYAGSAAGGKTIKMREVE